MTLQYLEGLAPSYSDKNTTMHMFIHKAGTVDIDIRWGYLQIQVFLTGRGSMLCVLLYPGAIQGSVRYIDNTAGL